MKLRPVVAALLAASLATTVLMAGCAPSSRLGMVEDPATGEKAWMEIVVDTKIAGKGRCRYDGIVFEPHYTSTFRPLFPVFIKSVDLHR